MNKVFFLALISALLIEASITTLPIVLDLLLILFILKRNNTVFIAAFFAGIFLDLLLVGKLGQSSAFFLVFLFLASLYERKYEITSVYFLVFYSFLGSLLFLIILNDSSVFKNAIFSSAFTFLAFAAIKLLDFRLDKK